ncbi:ABCC1 [Lepeophtheirus salmonis]|uniref:ABCC1 n=1 Tax=Lepeophtheirus salmonis TaxID=72036 RepID=A0A7R8CZF9_LEPSM|nr:ABCC1 [Lepeophtheirus salmonis]CAF2975888.1 ABCC1 [Lepeophtheirus salmonis]
MCGFLFSCEPAFRNYQANSTTMYLNGFCSDRDPFWDPDYAWNTNDPNFTSCFRKTILQEKFPLKHLEGLRHFHVLFLILIAFVDLGYWGSKEFYPKDLINPIIRAITFLAVFILLFVERARGYRISPLLTSFFLIYFATNTIDLYGHIRWVMMSALLWTGFKRNLSFDDLWDLVPSLSSRTVVPIFLQRLDSALRRVKTNENGITYAKGDDNVEVKTKHEKKTSAKYSPCSSSNIWTIDIICSCH